MKRQRLLLTALFLLDFTTTVPAFALSESDVDDPVETTHCQTLDSEAVPSLALDAPFELCPVGDPRDGEVQQVPEDTDEFPTSR